MRDRARDVIAHGGRLEWPIAGYRDEVDHDARNDERERVLAAIEAWATAWDGRIEEEPGDELIAKLRRGEGSRRAPACVKRS